MMESKSRLHTIGGFALLTFSKRLLPGILLCICDYTLAALLLERFEIFLIDQRYLEALALALLLAWLSAPLEGGVDLERRHQLQRRLCSNSRIVLLGASVSATMVAALGSILILGIAYIVTLAIAPAICCPALFGLPQRMAILIACGNSICGNSAIAAVAPVIGADADDIASSISFTAVLGVVVVLGLPLLVPILQLSLTQYGVLAGPTVYAVPQVLTATLPIGALSNQVGTVIKLVRVLMLGPVVLGLALLVRRVRPAPDRIDRRRPRLAWSWSIVGFLIVLAIRRLA